MLNSEKCVLKHNISSDSQLGMRVTHVFKNKYQGMHKRFYRLYNILKLMKKSLRGHAIFTFLNDKKWLGTPDVALGNITAISIYGRNIGHDVLF
jgi:hypothetical protein